MTTASNMAITEIKAFVPSKDFELSKRFYQHMGFTMASDVGGVAYFHRDHTSFLLQDFCAQGLAENFMMHMLVHDVDAWWNTLQESGIAKEFGVKITAIEKQPWRMRDFCVTDPSGVLWRIAQNTA
ncbi:MAG: VOC family protein [Pseudomonadota bacterium]